VFLFAAASACSGAGTVPSAVAVGLPGGRPAARSRRSARRRNATDPSAPDRIAFLGPHFAADRAQWFRRSDGRREIGGIPPRAVHSAGARSTSTTNTAHPFRRTLSSPPPAGPAGGTRGITSPRGEGGDGRFAMYAKGTNRHGLSAPRRRAARAPRATPGMRARTTKRVLSNLDRGHWGRPLCI